MWVRCVRHMSVVSSRSFSNLCVSAIVRFVISRASLEHSAGIPGMHRKVKASVTRGELDPTTRIGTACLQTSTSMQISSNTLAREASTIHLLLAEDGSRMADHRASIQISVLDVVRNDIASPHQCELATHESDQSRNIPISTSLQSIRTSTAVKASVLRRPLSGKNATNVWAKRLSDGGFAVAFANTGPVDADIACDPSCWAAIVDGDWDRQWHRRGSGGDPYVIDLTEGYTAEGSRLMAALAFFVLFVDCVHPMVAPPSLSAVEW